MNILVRNLSRKTSENTLRQLFSSFGLISSLNIVMDEITGQSKGFGFVEMPENKEALKAIKALNNSQLDGERIRVKVTNQRKK
ncbi:MAG: RNA-binding protein [Spirochaetales bacterium]|nr:RNA-binding protein [Spirochaetales bacterium]